MIIVDDYLKVSMFGANRENSATKSKSPSMGYFRRPWGVIESCISNCVLCNLDCEQSKQGCLICLTSRLPSTVIVQFVIRLLALNCGFKHKGILNEDKSGWMLIHHTVTSHIIDHKSSCVMNTKSRFWAIYFKQVRHKSCDLVRSAATK